MSYSILSAFDQRGDFTKLLASPRSPSMPERDMLAGLDGRGDAAGCGTRAGSAAPRRRAGSERLGDDVPQVAIPALLGEPFEGLLMTCVGVPDNTSRPGGLSRSPTVILPFMPRLDDMGAMTRSCNLARRAEPSRDRRCLRREAVLARFATGSPRVRTSSALICRIQERAWWFRRCDDSPLGFSREGGPDASRPARAP
jgi:hypothetical protein